MSKYYIIARKENNSYTSIYVNNGRKLEDIDLYTCKYNNKNELLKDLKEEGLDTSEGLDLFIASYDKRTKHVRIRPVLYKAYYTSLLMSNARRSLKHEPIYTKIIYDKVSELSKSGYYLHLVRRGYFDLYNDFRDMVAKGNEKLVFSSDHMWLRDSYANFRDATASILQYWGLRIDKDTDIGKIIDNKVRLRRERNQIYSELETTLKEDVVGQISLFNNNTSIIHIDHIHKDNLIKVIQPTVIVKKHIVNIPSYDGNQFTLEDYIKDDEMALNKSLIEDIDNKDSSNREKNESKILYFLTNPKYFSSSYVTSDEKKYYINFDKLPFELSDNDQEFISKLIPSRMLGLMKEFARYKEIEDIRRLEDAPTSDIYEDKANCYNEMKRVLNKYSDSTYKKIEKFAILYKDCYDRSKDMEKGTQK